MVTMKAMPTPDQTAYTTPTSKPLTLKANESKVRLSAEKTTVASAGRSFENPCESFKEMAAVSSNRTAASSITASCSRKVNVHGGGAG